MFRELDSAKTVATIRTLAARIDERFPASSLCRVCREVIAVAEASRERAEWIGRPHVGLRIATALLILAMLALLGYTVSLLELETSGLSADGVFTVIDAVLNEIVYVGAALLFLVTVEARRKRKRALEAIDELRAIAHVIDMHQLTKDPVRIVLPEHGTASSPEQRLTPFELTRYLDYCTEMLSLTGKVAALYAQKFPDAVVLAAVNEVEGLTTGLSRKIWQKIMILHGAGFAPQDAGGSGA